MNWDYPSNKSGVNRMCKVSGDYLIAKYSVDGIYKYVPWFKGQRLVEGAVSSFPKAEEICEKHCEVTK